MIGTTLFQVVASVLASPPTPQVVVGGKHEEPYPQCPDHRLGVE